MKCAQLNIYIYYTQAMAWLEPYTVLFHASVLIIQIQEGKVRAYEQARERERETAFAFWNRMLLKEEPSPGYGKEANLTSIH